MEFPSNHPATPMPNGGDALITPPQPSMQTPEQVKRRTFMMGAAAVVGLGVAINETGRALDMVQEFNWPDEPTRIETWTNRNIHDPEVRKRRKFPRANLSSDGFGGRSAFRLVELNMAQDSPVDSRLTIYGGYRFGKQGITGDGMRYAAHRFYKDYDTDSVALTGRSMGTQVIFHAAAAAKSVERMLFNSGPMDLDDARDAAAARIAVATSRLIGYEGNIEVQTLVNLFNQAREHGPAEFAFMLKDAFDLTLRSEDPEIIQAELEFLATNDPQTTVRYLKRTLRDDTIVGYIFAERPETDLVVNPVTSYEKIKGFFLTNFGIEVKALAYKKPGHALMEEGVEAGANYISSLYKEIDPYDSVQRKHFGQMPGRPDTDTPVISEKAREKLSKALASGVLPPMRQKFKY